MVCQLLPKFHNPWGLLQRSLTGRFCEPIEVLEVPIFLEFDCFELGFNLVPVKKMLNSFNRSSPQTFGFRCCSRDVSHLLETALFLTDFCQYSGFPGDEATR